MSSCRSRSSATWVNRRRRESAQRDAASRGTTLDAPDRRGCAPRRGTRHERRDGGPVRAGPDVWLAEAGGLELRIFRRDGQKVSEEPKSDPAESPNADVVNAFLNEDRKSTRLNSSHVAIYYAVLR